MGLIKQHRLPGQLMDWERWGRLQEAARPWGGCLKSEASTSQMDLYAPVLWFPLCVLHSTEYSSLVGTENILLFF